MKQKGKNLFLCGLFRQIQLMADKVPQPRICIVAGFSRLLLKGFVALLPFCTQNRIMIYLLRLCINGVKTLDLRAICHLLALLLGVAWLLAYCHHFGFVLYQSTEIQIFV